MYRPGLFSFQCTGSQETKEGAACAAALSRRLKKLLALADGDARAFAATAAAVAVHEESTAHQHDDEESTYQDAKRTAAAVVSHHKLHRLRVNNDEYRAINAAHEFRFHGARTLELIADCLKH
jgi:formiminotetrahydrofolate cyclodeaminase